MRNADKPKYKIGQDVVYLPTNSRKGAGRYVVIAVFPQPGGEPHYRIRSDSDPPLEYTAKAKELRKATASAG